MLLREGRDERGDVGRLLWGDRNAFEVCRGCVLRRLVDRNIIWTVPLYRLRESSTIVRFRYSTEK